MLLKEEKKTLLHCYIIGLDSSVIRRSVLGVSFKIDAEAINT